MFFLKEDDSVPYQTQLHPSNPHTLSYFPLRGYKPPLITVYVIDIFSDFIFNISG
jgi:hypothetical protein